MIENPNSPSCRQDKWESIARRTFRIADIEQLREYDSRRYRVLFEIWRPGDREFNITVRACRKCGFIIYSRRPDETDLERKYHVLTELEGKKRARSQLSESEVWRANKLYRELRDFLPDARPARVMDFGGGDGRLMKSFVEKGHRCSVLDWRESPIAGVESLGRTVHDIQKCLRFDAIIASHVIEHVAEPRAVLWRLCEFLEPFGVIYVEVPLEVWGSPPPRTEPVTHINFFVPGSLRRLLENAGFGAIRCVLGNTRICNRRERVIRAIARPGLGVNQRADSDAMD